MKFAQRFALCALVFASCQMSGMALAQSFTDAFRDLSAFAEQVDRSHQTSSPRQASDLERLKAAWSRLHQTSLPCVAKSVQVNGQSAAIQVVGPFQRPEGEGKAVLSFGFAIVWDNDSQAASLLLAQPFDTFTGKPTSARFIEGGYFRAPGAQPVATAGQDRWVDSPRPSSGPPIHQPWGAHLTMLARLVGNCRLP